MRRRTFSAEFKAKIVCEVLKDENEIVPNQIRNCKNEFIANAAYIFDNKKDEKLQETLKSNAAEKDSKELPLSTAAELLDVNRSSAYYRAKEPSETEQAVKNVIDKTHTDNPVWGSRQLSKQLI